MAAGWVFALYRALQVDGGPAGPGLCSRATLSFEDFVEWFGAPTKAAEGWWNERVDSFCVLGFDRRSALSSPICQARIQKLLRTEGGPNPAAATGGPRASSVQWVVPTGVALFPCRIMTERLNGLMPGGKSKIKPRPPAHSASGWGQGRRPKRGDRGSPIGHALISANFMPGAGRCGANFRGASWSRFD